MALIFELGAGSGLNLGSSYLAPTWLFQALKDTPPAGCSCRVTSFPFSNAQLILRMDIATQKNEARKGAFARRAEAHKTVKADIFAACLDVARDYEIIAAYMPMRTEIDVMPAMYALHNVGKQVCVPVITAKATPLTFCQWTPDCEMVEGEFGALIPAKQTPIIPDIVLAPLVAYDAQGTRLGYGGGFYDRTLEKLRAQKPVPYYGLAYSAQKATDLPRDQYDLKLDGIITENGLQIF